MSSRVLPFLPALMLAATLMLVIPLGRAQDSDSAEPPASAGPPMGPPPVPVATPLQIETLDWDEFTGRFEALERVEIAARVGGYVESVRFKEGQQVRQGDLLFVIDRKPLEAEVARAEAELRQAEAGIAQAQAAVAEAKARATQANAEVRRGERLIAGAAISREEVETRRANQATAAAALEAAEANVAAARAAVGAAEARLRVSRLDLTYTRVTAPISGRISDSLVDPGALVSGGGGAPATTLATLVSADPIEFAFQLSEADYLRYARRFAGKGEASPARVQVRLADETDWLREGTITSIGVELGQGTGTIPIRAQFANPDGFLTPGTFGRLRLQTGEAYKALAVPDSAIQADQSRKILMVLAPDGKSVMPRPVTLGNLVGPLRVIREGLDQSDRVVISGLQRARPGAPVTPLPGGISPETGVIEPPPPDAAGAPGGTGPQTAASGG